MAPAVAVGARYRGIVARRIVLIAALLAALLLSIAVDGVIVFAGTDTTEPLVGKLSPDEAAAYGASIRRCARRLVLGKAVIGGIASTGCPSSWEFPIPPSDDLRIEP